MELSELYKIFLQSTGVCTDTRGLAPGNIFFALKGDNFNGNEYAIKAIESGASYAVIDEPGALAHPRFILTSQVLKTLQDLAKMHRQQFRIPFIAITGSNGKTTTKELAHAVLSTHFKTYTTSGNLNNHIGIPLTLLRVNADAQMAIVEMGANHLHEIEGYCRYALPTHGLITNCGKAHLEGFGSTENIMKGKGELFDFIRETGGSVFINNDYDYLLKLSKGISTQVSYGTKNADYTGEPISSTDGFLEVKVTKGAQLPRIKTQLVGDYNLPNVLAAIAMGKTFGVPDEKIQKALQEYAPSNSRSQMIEKNGAKIILDAYNANPSSMQAAIANFGKMHGGPKYVFLGGMKEMGAESKQEHLALINLLKSYTWEKVVLVGKEFSEVPAPFVHVEKVEDARPWLKKIPMEGARILIKGSRGISMEKLLEGF